MELVTIKPGALKKTILLRVRGILLYAVVSYCLLVPILWFLSIGITTNEPIGPVPLVVIHASWPAFALISVWACILGWSGWQGREWFRRSKWCLARSGDLLRKGCLLLYLAGVVLLLATTYLTTRALRDRHLATEFQAPISEAIGIVAQPAKDRLQTGTLSVRDPLVVVINAYKYPREAMVPVHDFVMRNIGLDVFISRACGDPPKNIAAISTIVLVYRQRRQVALYTGGSSHYQWRHEAYVVDWHSRATVAQKTFEGGLPDTPATKMSSRDWYGSEPWPDIRSFLSGL